MILSKRGLFGILPPVVLIFAAIFALRLSNDIQELGFDPLDAAFFPRLIAWLVLLLAAIDLTLTVIRTAREKSEATSNGGDIRLALLQAGLAFASFALFCVNAYYGWLSYPISGSIFFLVCGAIYIGSPKKKDLITLVAVAIALPSVLNAAFNYFFYVQIP